MQRTQLMSKQTDELLANISIYPIYELLYELRVINKLSKRNLEECTDIPYSRIRYIESKECVLSLTEDEIDIISQFYGISRDILSHKVDEHKSKSIGYYSI